MKIKMNYDRQTTLDGLLLFFVQQSKEKRFPFFNILAAFFIVINIPMAITAFKLNNIVNVLISVFMIFFFSYSIYSRTGNRQFKMIKKHVYNGYDKLVSNNSEFPFEKDVEIEILETMVTISFDERQESISQDNIKSEIVESEIVESEIVENLDDKQTENIESEFEQIDLEGNLTSGAVSIELNTDVKLIISDDMFVYYPKHQMPIFISKNQMDQKTLEEFNSIIDKQNIQKVYLNV